MAKVSKQQLASYGIPDNYFFPTRQDRDGALPNPSLGTYCAVANDANVKLDDTETAYWYLECFNGANWTIVSISEDYALIITNEGLKALTQADLGGYKLEISRVCIREQSVPTGSRVIEWVSNDFIYGTPNPSAVDKSLLVLDSNYIGNTTFTLKHNFSWRINLANGGVQYNILLDVDTIGLDFSNNLGSDTNPQYVQKVDYQIGAIGLYVKNPSTGAETLFAVGNLSKPIQKYTTTATRIGNSIRIYLNTTLSNLGYVQDLSVLPESVGSIPEVVTEEDLLKTYNADYTPYNLYLVDNLYDSGVPALAVRKGDPVSGSTLTWTYFTPNDNSMEIDPSIISEDVKDYMVVAYENGRYIPATGISENPKPQGIKVGDSIIFDGSVVNNTTLYSYTFSLDNGGTGYEAGQRFSITAGKDPIKFIFTITAVNTIGRVLNYTVNITSGDQDITVNSQTPNAETSTTGSGLLFSITSTSRTEQNSITWNFSPDWFNKPLYVTADASKAGELTIEETAAFIGWCTGSNSIKLSLDLRSEATYTKYGTTKYASNDQVKNANTASHVTKVAVAPRELYNNYLQTTVPDNSSQRGASKENPIIVDTYTKFNKVIVGKGMSSNDAIDSDVSFYGRSYRAKWGDLAEFYKSDRLYLPGTLITIGAGTAEITEAKIDCNGIISDKPGYTLGEKLSDYDLPVALIGKVPVRFSSDCDPKFGNRIYLSKTEPGKASTIPNGKCLGKVIDKGKDLNRQLTIMCSVKISF